MFTLKFVKNKKVGPKTTCYIITLMDCHQNLYLQYDLNLWREEARLWAKDTRFRSRGDHDQDNNAQ